jgi:hypothetical protein|tara:strand:- start:1625 stop:2818 length:1194 start_codon:yes stop_codon:yes gene_type:complete
MKIIELILDEDLEFNGVDAISIVENPAIQTNFVALKDQSIKLAEVSKEKRLLLGPILIPNKPILRNGDDEDYYIYFSKDTVEKASQLYLKQGNQSQATLEHEYNLKGLTLVESWIVNDEVHDKSRLYDNTKEVPLGTWMGSIRVDSDEVWQKYVKEGIVKGFSIEGYFADKLESPNESINDFLSQLEGLEAEFMLSEIESVINNEEIALESFNDYPDGVANNAKKGIELNEKINNRCATDVGKIRAQQLAQKKNITVATIKRMYSYLSRAEDQYRKNENDSEACANISYLLWGGLAALGWSRNKLRQLGELELETIEVNEDFIIIDGRLAYSSKEIAEEIATDLGCQGSHVHIIEEKEWFMPCEQHELKEPCQAGYEMYGFKIKNGKRVPNCVPIKR